MSSCNLQNGQTIFYYELNANKMNQENPSLLFVHGNFSAYNWWFDIIHDKRFQNYHIICPDLRGFGKSTYINKCQCFGDWAKDLRQLIQRKGILKVYANGWSFGGAIVMKLAQLAPDIVSRIILTASVSHKGLKLKKGEYGQFCQTLDQIRQTPSIQYSINILTNKDYNAMRVIFDTILYLKTNDYSQERKQDLAKSPFQQRNLIDVWYSFAHPDINIDKIKSKVLMIHGDQDNVLPYQTIQQTGKILGSFELWKGHAHMIPVECPQRYIQRISQFYDQ